MAPDFKKAFEQALNKKILVSRGERKVLMTRAQIGFEQLLNQFAKGDRYARRDVMEYCAKLGIDFLANYKQTLEEALTPNYQAIVDGSLGAEAPQEALRRPRLSWLRRNSWMMMPRSRNQRSPPRPRRRRKSSKLRQASTRRRSVVVALRRAATQ